MQDYGLREVSPGVTAYFYQKEPHHWICKDCADNKNLKTQLLPLPVAIDWTGRKYHCPKCGTVIEISKKLI